ECPVAAPHVSKPILPEPKHEATCSWLYTERNPSRVDYFPYNVPRTESGEQRASLDTRRKNTMAQLTPAQRMEHVIRTYIQACNDADAAAIAACFCPEAVHYLPA